MKSKFLVILMLVLPSLSYANDNFQSLELDTVEQVSELDKVQDLGIDSEELLDDAHAASKPKSYKKALVIVAGLAVAAAAIAAGVKIAASSGTQEEETSYQLLTTTTTSSAEAMSSSTTAVIPETSTSTATVNSTCTDIVPYNPIKFILLTTEAPTAAAASATTTTTAATASASAYVAPDLSPADRFNPHVTGYYVGW